MKSLFYSILIIPLTIVSCSGEAGEDADQTEENETEITTDNEVVDAEPPVNTFSIGTEMVGIFRVGESVPDPLPEELKTRQFLETDIDDDGKSEEHTHNVVFTMLEDVLELIMEKGSDKHHEDKHITEMIVLSNYYQTDKDIGVGSTIEEFKEAYPDMTVWYDKVHDNYHLETETLIGVQFIFDADDVKREAKGSADHQEISASYINEGADIDIIRVH